MTACPNQFRSQTQGMIKARKAEIMSERSAKATLKRLREKHADQFSNLFLTTEQAK